ncbi:MAG: DUF1028 domain-containing protein [Actinobacteria bacterium]|nr:MAG: DUF1028 domain-containing protein [Actinomycetota bacterium]
MWRLATFSIVGRCDRTGQLGVAVSTADVGAGRLVTWAKAGVGAVATQSWPSLYLAIDALRLMEDRWSAPEALERVLADDPGRALRQLGTVDAQGRSATFSGDECTTWYGGLNGPNFAAQGNMLIRGETVSAMVDSFEATNDLDLGERLLRALEAGQAAGGDKRGRQCSALLVVDREEFPLWDLRVDEHPQPVVELRRIYEIARLQLLPFVEGLPTRINPLGSLSDEFIEMNLLPPPQRPGGGGSGPPAASDDGSAVAATGVRG